MRQKLDGWYKEQQRKDFKLVYINYIIINDEDDDDIFPRNLL